MQEQHSFEYAVIRVVPKVEREEFFNVGVILYCPSLRFLRSMIHMNEEKLRSLCTKADIELINNNLKAFEAVCNGTATNSPIARMDIASRFRWLTATRSTIVQSSKVHPGLCTDPMAKLNQLFNEMVL